ncbi:MAG: hypothetical protein IPK55_15395 [Streptococcus sp.]|nr:hypothetical protein [Streptococcus sp.]
MSKETEGRGELPVKATIINPKAVTIDQLYGYFDPVSHDFTDRILGKHFKTAAYNEVGQSRQWITFDGPVDANWIENMNTVLDDN